MLIEYGDMTEENKRLFYEDCKKYCDELKEKDVTCYFVDMINICLNYEFVPPDFLFCMAKAFICLNGISNFSENKYTAKKLLKEQTAEFVIKRNIEDCKKITNDSLNIIPELFDNTMQYGLINTIAKLSTNDKLRDDIRVSLEDLKETLDLMKTEYDEDYAQRDRCL